MKSAAKIATCSYCHSRVVIPLSAAVRQELVCNSCGAPLKNTEIINQSVTPPPPNPIFATPPVVKQKKPATEFRESKKRDSKKKARRPDTDEPSRKRKSRDSDNLLWGNELEDLARKYKKKIKKSKYNKKKSGKKKRGLMHWIREAVDEIDDFLD